MYVKHLTCL